jgi:hypothetical protein
LCLLAAACSGNTNNLSGRGDSGVADLDASDAAAFVDASTYHGTIDFAWVTDESAVPTTVRIGRADVAFYDAPYTAYVASATVAAPFQSCQLETIDCWSARPPDCAAPAVGSNVGSFRMDFASNAGQSAEIVATFSSTAGRYITRPGMSELDVAPMVVVITGDGYGGVARPWSYAFSAPYPLRPDAMTQLLLQDPNVTTTRRDLVFDVSEIMTQPIAESVRVELIGDRYRIRCDDNERDPTTFRPSIVMSYDLILAFMQKEQISFGSGRTAPLVVERVTDDYFSPPGASTATTTTRVELTVRVADRYLGRVQF